MCGRYTYLFKWKQLHLLMRLLSVPPAELAPRYNVAPTQSAPVVRADEGGGRVGVLMRWGLVPFWANDLAVGNKMINARAETLATSRAYKTAYSRRRCLVPISGFYEWRTVEGLKVKQPYWIGRSDRAPFALAGLWERWDHGGQEPAVETFTIITTGPNALLRPIHNRMPVILEAADYDRWLDPGGRDAAGVAGLLRPHSGKGFEAYTIGRRVNNPRVDDPSLVEPAPPIAPESPGPPEREDPGLF